MFFRFGDLFLDGAIAVSGVVSPFVGFLMGGEEVSFWVGLNRMVERGEEEE